MISLNGYFLCTDRQQLSLCYGMLSNARSSRDQLKRINLLTEVLMHKEETLTTRTVR